MPTCPNGHQSGSDDWCEVCGHRMAGAVPPPPPPPPAAGYGYPPPPPGQDPGFPQPAPPRPHLAAVPDPSPEAELCPQCRTPREANAPFCEECRWNFLTNTATSYTPAAPNPPLPGTHGGPGPGPGMPPPGPNPAQQFPPPPGPGYEYQGSRPSQVNRPAEPIPPFGNGGAHGGGNGNGFGQQGPGQPGPGQPGQHGQPGPGQPGPGQTPPGAPQAFQQPGPPAPPAFPQETGGPQGPPPPPPGPQGTGPGQPGPGQPGPGGPSFGGGGDDWVLSPPSSPAPAPGRQEPFPQESFQQGPPQPQAAQGPGTWTATIGPDREYFMAMMQRSGPEASGLNLPAYSPEQQRPLVGNQITIGRRRHSTGDTPDIDLSVPPEDPGVSHQHAVLVQQPDSSWAVVDQNSTNGTTVNHGEEPIQPFVPIPLQDGDQVHVGAWTTITIRRD
ncbi:FHA domain-containing protein [Streptomyces formicae]|uniref:FHA domain-containing protein n=1 Tax=Streptomyces formicae TaxID=1616117 RepID=A0A291Q7Z4_9ACTN|nr:FHA domain-containing protein [Streptomyces formicae]ATL27829.1 hypothetical protein KY5_2811 [Streptomyces formicae]